MRIVLLLISLAGFGLAAGKLFVWGDSSVGYGSYVPWGLWVGAYGYLVALAAGSALVANLHYAFGREEFRDTARPALLVSVISLITGLALIALDLGHPFRGIRILFMPDLEAFLPWATWSYVGFLVVSLLLLRRAGKGRQVRVLGRLSLFFAAVFIILEALHFSTVIAHPTWNSALTLPLFFASAVALGFSLLALLRKSSSAYVRNMLIVHLLMVDVMELGKVLVEWYSATPAMAASAAGVFSSPFFWCFLAFGVVAPLVLLLRSEVSAGALKAAAACVMVGLFAAKYEFVSSAFALAQFSELPAAFRGPGLTTHYVPTLLEVGVTVGLLAAAALAFLWLWRPARKVE